MENALIQLDAVKTALQNVKTLPEAKDGRDKLESLRQYAARRRMSHEIQNEIAEAKIRYERKCGEFIQEMQERGELATRGQPTKEFSHSASFLSDFGINHSQSSRWQKIAVLPISEFERYIGESKNAKDEITSAGIYRIARRHQKEKELEAEKALIAELEALLAPTDHEQCFYQDNWTQVWWADSADLFFIEDNAIDLIVTSPQYNIGPKESGGRILWGGVKYAGDDDKKPEDEYRAEQIQILDELWRVTKPGGSLFYNHKVRNRGGQGIHPFAWLQRTKWNFRQQIIWNRGSTHNHEMTYFWPIDELIFWLSKGTKNVYLSPEGARMSTIWRFDFDTNSDHPAPFPEELASRCIRASSRPGDLVLDPFGGSMTTCIVAKKLRRYSIGVDIAKQYVVKYAARCSQGILL